MLYQFNQQVAFFGKTYARGIHEVPEDVENHPYFMKLVESGLVVETDKEEEPQLVSHQERMEKLRARLKDMPVKPSASQSEVHRISLKDQFGKPEGMEASPKLESEEPEQKPKKKPKG